MENSVFKRKDWIKSLKLISPGNPLRDGVDLILDARGGALIVVGNPEKTLPITVGGFPLDIEFTPARLFELSKMDGAIILNADAKTILRANALLIPNPNIPTVNTGSRHQAAERFAKQTGELIIAISERRGVVTLYKGDLTYPLKSSASIMSRANQALTTLDSYKQVFNRSLEHLSVLEFTDSVTASDIANIITRAEMLKFIEEEIDTYIIQLGKDGLLTKWQLLELMSGVEEIEVLILKDYLSEEKLADIPKLLETLKQLKSEQDILDQFVVMKHLGFNNPDQPLIPRGYRVLDNIPRLPSPIVEKIVGNYKNLNKLLGAKEEELDKIEGVGKIRAHQIVNCLMRMKEITKTFSSRNINKIL
ncbi:DNA integrity scanning, DisA, linker region [Thermodesulfobium narugense DSM 14796]|uniref:DNA integrity scanning, DisA, linker region n=2 Tax=Thermodesulfobium narugense TaxID=184064 RepID=M1E638_9BACT|nr:DNA integrity scanning, DisA, linker region [Thermodesulfobium narugense DSM 14796]